MTAHLLTLIIFVPLIGALAVALFADERTIWTAAFIFSLLPLALSVYLLFIFNPLDDGYQFVERYPWIADFGVSYHVGVDGISLFLVPLASLLVSLTLLYAGGGDIDRRAREFCFFVLMLETGLLGVLLAVDVFLFYVFWELALIPMYFIIGIWGSQHRVYAAFKFILYTMVGSLLMLVGLIYLVMRARGHLGAATFDLPELFRVPLSHREAQWLFAALALGFAVKVPVWPLHSWVPDAYSEAPTAGSMLLGGAMFQMGMYGFLRFAIPLFPEVAREAAPLFMILGVVGIIYGALLALAQSDFKRLVAYASVSHVGFTVLGVFVLDRYSVDGAVYQLITHGLSTTGLFLGIGMIYLRWHTRMIGELGGLWRLAPMLCGTLMVMMLSAIGLPGLDGFVGEFLVLLGTYFISWQTAAVAVLGLILGALYMLWAYERAIFGPLAESAARRVTDLDSRDVAVVVPLLALMFFLGLYPRPVLRRIEPSVVAFLSRAQASQSSARLLDGLKSQQLAKVGIAR
jgi:NADH-quinone oxidoreductase subunit M